MEREVLPPLTCFWCHGTGYSMKDRVCPVCHGSGEMICSDPDLHEHRARGQAEPEPVDPLAAVIEAV